MPDPLPKRPASVPEQAHYVSAPYGHFSAAGWIMGVVDEKNGKFTGDYAQWNLDGIIVLKRVYDSTGELAEDYEYENGQLWVSKIHRLGERLQSFYYTDVANPVVRYSILKRNNGNERLETFFDRTGNVLYAIRYETVTDFHGRRYYNDILVYEHISTPDRGLPPASIRYFYPNGAIAIDYTSNGDGTGLWHLYDEMGRELSTLVESNEANNRWYKFLSNDYSEHTTQPDSEVMIATFRQEQAFASIRQKIHTLPIPAYLEKELQKVDWKTISCGMEHARDILPLAINGMLSDEEDIAEHCSSHIWWQIYSQGHIFIATYEVAVIFSRMLRHYTGNQAIQWRLVQFLSKVLGVLTNYNYNKIYYRKIITALRTSAQIIPQWVNAADDHTARIAQYLLAHVGQYIPGTEDLLKKEWNHPAHSLSRRSYAALSLAAFYTARRQREKLIAAFSAAFSTEEDRFLQMVIALQLVTTSKKKAQAPWISALITAFIELDHATEQFLYRLRPFADNYYLPDYILQVLGYANRKVVQTCMEPVIALLPDADKLKQANALEVIFAMLFPNKSALKRRTSLQKRALLAAAAVIDQHSYVIRHNEVFSKYQLPYNADQLRELVAGAGSIEK